jgi:tripartite-type tricarboxylate transporter receptor subunit TctC
MKLPRRAFLRIAAATALPISARPTLAQAYPTRPVRLIVGYSAGGTADIVARIIAQRLTERLGQPVVVENKPGATTNIATQTVISAAPDGHTLLYVTAANATNASLYSSLPFNFLRDIAPVAGLVEFTLVLVVNGALPVHSIGEFVAYAKANPGKISMASFGVGSTSHLSGELLKLTTGIDTVHVPYRGGAPMITDLVSGQVQAAFDALPESLPHIRTGALRPLAVTTAATRRAVGRASVCRAARRGSSSKRSTARSQPHSQTPPSGRGSTISAARYGRSDPTRSAPTSRPKPRNGQGSSSSPASGRSSRPVPPEARSSDYGLTYL